MILDLIGPITMSNCQDLRDSVFDHFHRSSKHQTMRIGKGAIIEGDIRIAPDLLYLSGRPVRCQKHHEIITIPLKEIVQPRELLSVTEITHRPNIRKTVCID